MMTALYYLSYIEINGHAALMLSAQEEPSKQAVIVVSIGFGWMNGGAESVLPFLNYQGHISEESIASKVLYSTSAKVKQKTFAISQEEVKKFLEILNRDRTLKVTTAQDSNGETINTGVVYGPKYQLLRHNCKTYALSVLKEIGIAEADKLSNYFVQRPGTTDELLKDLTKNDLCCPIKDEFIIQSGNDIDNIKGTLLELQSSVVSADGNVQLFHEKEEDACQSKDQFVKRITELYDLVEKIKTQVHKIDIDSESDYVQLEKLVQYVVKYRKIINDAEDSGFKPQLKKLEDHANQLIGKVKTIRDLARKNQLQVFWKESPAVTKRVAVENLTDEEQIVCATKLKSNEVVAALADMLTMLDEKMDMVESLTAESRQDLLDLKEILTVASSAMVENHNAFFAAIDQTRKIEPVELCVKYNEQLNTTLNTLTEKINSFQPKSTSDTGPFMNFIHKVLNVIKKDWFVAKNAVQHKIKTNLKAVGFIPLYKNRQQKLEAMPDPVTARDDTKDSIIIPTLRR